MANTKKVLLACGIAALVLFTLLSCFFLPTEDFAVDGWYIKLNIDPTTGSKSVSVTEYTVTELLIEVFDPDSQLIQTIHWYAGDGQQSYLIPVGEQGQYGIQITHMGEENGDEFEATESAAFNMQAMTITVIDITPGFIGVINIEPGDEEPVDPMAWIIGYWVPGDEVSPTRPATPGTPVIEIREDGTYAFYDSYFTDLTDPVEIGPWSTDMEITKVSDDYFYIIMMDEEVHLYRKGTEPGGWIFDQIPTPLSLSDEWTEGIISDLEIQLYSFQAPADGIYKISWKQLGDPDLPIYDADIWVAAYEEDQATQIFSSEIGGYEYPETVALAAGETIYITVDAWHSGGTYGIRVTPGDLGGTSWYIEGMDMDFYTDDENGDGNPDDIIISFGNGIFRIICVDDYSPTSMEIIGDIFDGMGGPYTFTPTTLQIAFTESYNTVTEQWEVTGYYDVIDLSYAISEYNLMLPDLTAVPFTFTREQIWGEWF